MGVEHFDYAIYQGRWFDDSESTVNGIRWSPWKNIEEWEYVEMLHHIEGGAKYQVRVLSQILIKGYGINPDYMDLYCPKPIVNPGL